MKPVLAVERLEKRYGVKTVVDQVSFTAAAGECLGIIGPNGAGKTTLFNLLDGCVAPNAGRVMLDDVDITHLPQYRRARRGIGRAFQIPRPFAGLTVFENVLAGVVHGADRSTAPQRRAIEILEAVGLAHKRDLLAGGLPLLDRKRLELAKAMSVGTRLLLLDEVAGGLTEHEVHQLVDIVNALKRDHAVIWIEHIAHALMAAADRIMVLHFGAKLVEGPPADVMASAIVQEVYLGISVDVAADR
ncbi:putative ABC transporter, ATP-binding protein [Bradyrhizobium sp. ORS 375]|nr:putative ABC transporter, ATP-binding protein [Bradyrhizobium sp. ORS 375]